MHVTTDLSKFGYRELEIAEQLLNAYREQGLPDSFYEDEINISFNTFSGFVFLTNSNYEVAMLDDDDKLRLWYTCAECGKEGFCEEFKNIVDVLKCQGCREILKINEK